ncbi:UDP-N-acetylmuramate dehydrogenase [Arthrobacter subterraneus]|uniref:UDP-N-acetylenolpyruvoylglucosamine reductase n=1 Tax=Arthrobacter subterraneus TaxID=335973 RepID=A0A1G8CQ96_9MICC|nr:UDP-N-acetylmuramate dehydrogenase [Arthrobacter subterraneus]SDH47655.1 UDP-N-acetylmuramate dehydrogenase [Arthrobacter subterraneus]
MTSLADFTTSAVGGPARTLVEARTEPELIEAIRSADAAGEPLLLLGGGSNLLVADSGFAGTVIRIATTGFTVNDDDATCGGVMVTAQAGQPWDELVEYTVRHAYSGLEALSGIPGSTGAVPVQNVGAYGAEVSQTIAMVRTYDRQTQSIRSLANADLKFGYRDSLLKRTTDAGSPRFVVLTVQFQLGLGRMSAPVRYAELARELGVAVGERAYATDVRRAVLKLRAAKGMVLDSADRDTYSTGSFFTNPVVDAADAASLPEGAPRYPMPGSAVKLSAAWLIEQAGFGKGFGLAADAGFRAAGGRASLSTKHTLAVTNRGGASAEDLLSIARLVADGVEERFGIRLHPEPLLIGCSLN